MNRVGTAVVVVGGYRTGSTLQYNLLGTYLEATGQGRRIGLVDPDDADSVLDRELREGSGIVVAKCHHLAAGFGNFRRPTAWRRHVESGTAIPVSTSRQEDDVKKSMARKFSISIDELTDSQSWKVDQANRQAWAEFAPFTQSYAQLTESPVEALRSLSHHLGVTWDNDAAHQAAVASGSDAARRVIRGIEPGAWDPVTLLHWDHLTPAWDGRSPTDSMTTAPEEVTSARYNTPWRKRPMTTSDGRRRL